MASNEQKFSNQFQDQLKNMQISVEAGLERLLQHWNLEHKLMSLQRKDVIKINNKNFFDEFLDFFKLFNYFSYQIY